MRDASELVGVDAVLRKRAILSLAATRRQMLLQEGSLNRMGQRQVSLEALVAADYLC